MTIENKYPTYEELLSKGLHKRTIEEHLKMSSSPTGYRFPHGSEWTEDYGLGYFDRLCWEADAYLKEGAKPQ